MKIFFRRIHLYLSLAAGLPILIACFTGAILVFEKDLEKAFHSERYYVQPAGKRLALETLQENVAKAFPGYRVTSLKLYGEAHRSAELNMSPAKKEKGSPEGKQKTSAGVGSAAKATGPQARGAAGPPPGFTVFMNPYTGQVLEKYSYRETFFFQMMALHRWLLGGNSSIGKYIMGVSTFIFMLILITGIILWWPKTRRILMQRLRIKTDAGTKRLNHDLHIVLGFYTAIFLFIFAFTAMSWSFEWFNNGLYALTKSSPKPPEAPKSTALIPGQAISFDQALASAQDVYGAALFYNIAAPKDSTDPFTVSVLMPDAAHENATHAVYVNQFNAQVAGLLPFEARNAGQKARSFVKPLHTGSIWGMPSKIIAFVVCLMGTSFPITGVIMWWNRTRKKKKTRRPAQAMSA